MTSKERVSAAVARNTPDRVPFGEYAVDSDTVERVLGRPTFLRNKAASKIALWEGRRDEVAASWKEDLVEFHRRLGCFDLVCLNAEATALLPPRNYEPERPRRTGDGVWEGPGGKVYKYSETTRDIVLVADPETWTRVYRPEDFLQDREPAAPDPSVFEVVDHVIRELGGEKYIIGPSGTPVELVLLGPMERALCELVENPETVKAAAAYYVSEGNALDAEYIRPGTDAVMWGQDFAYKNGPLVSPEMFREFVVPFAKERVLNIHENFRIPVIKHACGNNWALLDFFTEIGWDCYQSIQASAGMDLSEVKAAYGSRLALWGGVPLELLVSGTREEVAAAAKEAMEAGKPGGGYIFGSSHSIGTGTKYENFMTMVDRWAALAAY